MSEGNSQKGNDAHFGPPPPGVGHPAGWPTLHTGRRVTAQAQGYCTLTRLRAQCAGLCCVACRRSAAVLRASVRAVPLLRAQAQSHPRAVKQGAAQAGGVPLRLAPLPCPARPVCRRCGCLAFNPDKKSPVTKRRRFARARDACHAQMPTAANTATIPAASRSRSALRPDSALVG